MKVGKKSENGIVILESQQCIVSAVYNCLVRSFSLALHSLSAISFALKEETREIKYRSFRIFVRRFELLCVKR